MVDRFSSALRLSDLRWYKDIVKIHTIASYNDEKEIFLLSIFYEWGILVLYAVDDAVFIHRHTFYQRLYLISEKYLMINELYRHRDDKNLIFPFNKIYFVTIYE